MSPKYYGNPGSWAESFFYVPPVRSAGRFGFNAFRGDPNPGLVTALLAQRRVKIAR
jgi:hypothetical protein